MYKNILIALLLVLNFNQVKAANQDLYFIIYGDSHHIKEVYEEKKKLLLEFEDLVKGLDKEDYKKAIEDYLEYENATFENQTLVLVMGDGKGRCLKGKLEANYCKIEKDEIETQFFFKKIWQKATS